MFYVTNYLTPNRLKIITLSPNMTILASCQLESTALLGSTGCTSLVSNSSSALTAGSKILVFGLRLLQPSSPTPVLAVFVFSKSSPHWLFRMFP